VQKFNNSRDWQMTLGEFWGPSGVAIDPLGNIYVAVYWTNSVQVYGAGGTHLTTIGGSFGSQIGQFRHPTGVEVDADGNVYIADKDNHRIQKYMPGESIFLPLTVRN
jgi:DNA-binding beta-propeller fold protein YncE